MGAARDFAEITIVNEPLALTEPLAVNEPLRTLVERSVYADETPLYTDYVETPSAGTLHAEAPLTETPRNDTQQVGEKLAAARRAKGLALLDVAKGVKIKIEHLVAIEACDRDALPAVPFTAGFIKAYAQFLGLNADEYATAYRKETGAPTALTEGPAPTLQWETPQPAKREFSLPMGRDAFVSYFGIGAAAFCVAWFGASMLPRTAPAPRAAAEAVKTEAPVEAAAVAAAAKPVFETAPAQTEATAEIVKTAPEIVTAEVGTPTETAPVTTGPVAAKLAPAKTPAVVETATAATQTAETKVAETQPAATVAVQVETTAAPIKLPKGPRLAWAESEMKKEAAAKKAQVKREKAEAARAAAAKAEAEKTARALAEAEAAEAAVTDLRADVAAMNVSAPVETAPVETAPVEAAPAPVGPVAPQQNILAARILRAATPVYPERCARNAAAEESVNVIFSITVEGRPVGAAVVDTTNACFNSAAVDAASDMRFAPRKVDGKASIETAKVVTIRFTR